MPCMRRLGAHHPFLPSMHSLRCPLPNYPPRPCMCRPGQHPACPPASPHSCGSRRLRSCLLTFDAMPLCLRAGLSGTLAPWFSTFLAIMCFPGSPSMPPLFARRPVWHPGPLVLHLPRNHVVPRRLHPHLRRPLCVHGQRLLWLLGKPHVRSPVVHGRDRVQGFRPKPQAWANLMFVVLWLKW